MSLETTHAGYQIHYSENDDLWRCWELDLDAPSLSALKNKINQWDAKARRLSNIPVLILSQYDRKPSRGTATMIDRDGGVWCAVETATRHHGVKSERKKLKPESLILDNPEGRSAIAELQRLAKIEDEAREAVKAARDKLPRPDLGAFKALEENDLGGQSHAR